MPEPSAPPAAPRPVPGSAAPPARLPPRGRLRLPIAAKLLLVYFLLVASAGGAAVFVIERIDALGRINRTVVERDVPIVEATEKMIESVLATESYGNRFVLLGSQEALRLYRVRRREFREQLARLVALDDREGLPLDEIAELHRRYGELFERRFAAAGAGEAAPPAAGAANGAAAQGLPAAGEEAPGESLAQVQSDLIDLLSRTGEEAETARARRTASISALAENTGETLILYSIVAALLGGVVVFAVIRNVSNAVRALVRATEEFSAGHFDAVPDVRSRDELADLAGAFGEMARRLERLEQMRLDASPLTGLPGGVALELRLRECLEQGGPFALCLLDLDNFKAFNDHYGYARGSELIKRTARIVEAAVREHGGEADLVAHVGGDDFAVVTTPERAEAVCESVIERFESTILYFYDAEDRRRGHIVSKTRLGETVRFPLTTISIAVVTNERRRFASHIEVGEVAAELKEHAKSVDGNVYLVNRRAGGPDEPSSGA